MNVYFKPAKQLLPKETYYSQDFLDEEKSKLFDQCWIYATTLDKLQEPGDYVCFQYMNHPLLVVDTENCSFKSGS